MFRSQDAKPHFWNIQQHILSFRKDHSVFEKSVSSRPASDPYLFFDGPPFITGMPHYGSLLSSICKDVIPRYQTMKGKRVERVRGRDCHGIPIEQKVQKEMGLETNKDIEKAGVETFINQCYTYTRSTSAERNRYINNIGRWVDMDNAYKTMDNDYMESVMRVFKQFWEKSLIYRGKRVSLYSTKLSTPISNFEVAMDDTYEEINDPAITVKFPLFASEQTALPRDTSDISAKVYALARTTTPRTIPCNMSLAVNNDLEYVLVHYNQEYYVVAKNRTDDVFTSGEYTIVQEFLGEKLVGLSYEPPYDYYYKKTNNEADHKIYSADFITDQSGTGIGHEAPEFGDVDFELAQKVGLTISEAMDDAGKFTSQITDKEGLFYRDQNDAIIEELKTKNALFHKGSITHRVAFCPRSGVPLVYKAQDSWFIDIQSLKPKLLEKNKEINRYPEHFKFGRFAKSLESAPDRCISRTRYRGTPMPVWQNEDASEIEVIGSRDELFLKNKPYKQLTKIIFVRHGRTDYNDEGRHDHEGSAKLVDFGWEQAHTLAKKYKNQDIAAVYSSPLQRCVDTVTPLSAQKDIEMTIDERISEIRIPKSQDQLFDCSSIVRNDLPIDGRDSESIKEVYQRVEEFLKDVVRKHAGQTIVVCSHGDPLVLMRKVLHDFDYETDKYKRYMSNKKHKDLTCTEYVLSEPCQRLNLHKPWIDSIYIQSASGQKMTRRSEVLDCWFESGSMPYAQVHYPFENKSKFETAFPADYVVEYTGQIRAWFYVMHVLGVVLFDKPAFKNVLCTGVMKGDDGRKMSKSYGNYPDPKRSFEKYGGDAVRLQSLLSPVVYGGDVDVKESGFLEATKTVLLPLWNVFYFFTTYANIDGWIPQNDKSISTEHNFLDGRIVSELQLLIQTVDHDLAHYSMHTATRSVMSFLDDLTNRYIRRSRRRFRKSENDGDKIQAYETLYQVLLTLSQLMAPLIPFTSEYIYRGLVRTQETQDLVSVHLTRFPVVEKSLINKELSSTMQQVKTVVSTGLAWRSNKNIRVRQPLQSVTIGFPLDQNFQDIIQEELNVKQVIVDPTINQKVQKIVKPDGKLLGKKLGADFKTVLQLAKSGQFEQGPAGTVLVDRRTLQPEEYEIGYIKVDETLDIEVQDGMVVAMDPTITPELELEGFARDLVRFIQESRKEAGYDIADRISLSLSTTNLSESDESFLKSLLQEHGAYIQEETLSTIVSLEAGDIKKDIELGTVSVVCILKK